MANKKKTGAREKVMLVSTGVRQDGKPTKSARYTYKNKRNTEAKLELMKFDPIAWDEDKQKAGAHRLHKEKKIPK